LRQTRSSAHPQSTDEVVDGAAETVPPVDSRAEKAQHLNEALEASHAKIERLVESLEEVRDRRTYLETLRTQNLARFDRIAAELSVIQASLIAWWAFCRMPKRKSRWIDARAFSTEGNEENKEKAHGVCSFVVCHLLFDRFYKPFHAHHGFLDVVQLVA
jgi:hypothetical protein